MRPTDDPFGTVGLVVAGLAVLFAGGLLAAQFGTGDPAGVLTIPVVLAVPLLAAGAYWAVRRR